MRRLGVHVEGITPQVHPNKNGAGYIGHANAPMTITPDANDKRMTCTDEEVLRAGADAASIHVNVGSDHEPEQLEDLAELAKSAERYGLPVLAMTYVRDLGVDERVVEVTCCPVIVAGGSPRDDRPMLEQVRGAMDADVAGVSMGWSAFQHENSEASLASSRDRPRRRELRGRAGRTRRPQAASLRGSAAFVPERGRTLSLPQSRHA